MDDDEVDALFLNINRFLDYPENLAKVKKSTIKFIESVEKYWNDRGEISSGQIDTLMKIYENMIEDICP